MPSSTKESTKSRTGKSKTNTKKYAPRVKDYSFNPYYITYIKPTDKYNSLRPFSQHRVGEGETYKVSVESVDVSDFVRPYLRTGRLTAHQNSKYHKEMLVDFKKFNRANKDPTIADKIMARKQVKAARKNNKRKTYNKVKKYAAYDELNPFSRRYSKVPDWV